MTESQLAYREYLESDHWRQLRTEAFRVLGRKCSRCPSTCRLQVHHVVYRWPWESAKICDLLILCRPCHESEHGIAQPVIIQQPVHRQKKRRSGAARREMRRVNKLLARQAGRKGYQKRFGKKHPPKAKQWYYHQPRRRWVSRGNSSN